MSNVKQQGMSSSTTTVPADKCERAKQLLKEASHTRDEQGEYKDIAEWHAPIAEKNDEGRVRVQVHQDHHPHKSKSEKELPEHYVESIFVVDTESNEVAAYADFPPSFEHEYGPMLEATLSRKEKYVPYSYCNQHGLWKGEPF